MSDMTRKVIFIVNCLSVCCIPAIALFPQQAHGGIQVKRVQTSLSELDTAAMGKLAAEPGKKSIWADVPVEVVSLMAQPMAIPRPSATETREVRVQAVHDGNWVVFRLRWKSPSLDEAGILGKFSDAVAVQFPVKEGSPPPVFMGAKDHPVHIYHWRAQYQRDHERGKPTMKDLYPNMNPDMYPMEYADPGRLQGLTQDKREVFSPGVAAGNPQSYQKPDAVDEIFAEGFGSSSVIENRMSRARGEWAKKEWDVWIARPLSRPLGSTLVPGKAGFVAIAVWQGEKKEVGSRKSVTMTWIPLQVDH